MTKLMSIIALKKLAFKNLMRYANRTLITAGAIAFGIMTFITIDSLLKGVGAESERNLIQYETASSGIFHPEWWDKREESPLDCSVDNSEGILAELESLGIPSTPRIIFSGDIVVYKDPYPEYGTIPAQFIAIDPDKDPDVFDLEKGISKGRFLEPEDEGIMIGEWLAEDLGADLGYPITIMTKTKDGYYQTLDLDIIGIINTENPLVNRNGIYLPLSVVDEALEMEGTVTAIYSSLALPTNSFNLHEESKRFSEIEALALKNQVVAYDWRLMGKDYLDLAEAKAQGSNSILFLVFLIAAVGITNTLLMTIFERTRELGMMRALGMRDRELRYLLFFESSGIGLLGSSMGIALGALVNCFMVYKGIDYSALLRDMDMGYRITGIMYGQWSISTFVIAFFMGIIMSMVIAIFPTKRAIKMTITDCLRFN